MSHHHRRAAAVSAPDPYFSSTVLLLTGNGTNGGQNNTFLDSSTNNFTITRNGNTTQGSFSPFGWQWSNYFDGSGDYLSISDNAALELDSGDFTIEGWMYLNALPASSNSAALVSKWASGQKSWLAGIYNSSGTYQVFFSYTTNGSTQTNIAGNITSLAVGSWNHLAYCRSGSTFRSFFNGSEVTSSATISGTLFNGTSTVDVGRTADNFNYINGYISNCRLVKSAIYTSNFTPSTTPLTAITNTQLLTCQSNRFIDNSSNAFAITRNGDVTVSNFAPFPAGEYAASVEGGSGYFDGTGDYLTIADNSAFGFGTADFTVEGWFYAPSPTSGNKVFADTRTNYSSGQNWVFGFANGITPYYYDGSDKTATSSMTARTWNHVAWVRYNGNIYIYLNGSSVFTPTASTVGLSSAKITIGTDAVGAFSQALYISSLRLIKGTAQYTSNFTPSTKPLTAITNTQLLTCQSNRFVDNSSNAFAITRNGDVAVSNFAPFPAGEYAASVEGGSGYFDGTGDYLTAGGQTAYQFGTGDFTIEFWIYFTSVSGQSNIMDFRGSAGTPAIAPVIYRLSGVIRFFTNGSDRIVGTTSVTTGQWYHIAVARSGTSTKLFLNGTQEGSTYTDSNSYGIGTNAPSIGSSFTTTYVNGYISSLRLIAGTAQYTSNFTPPTAPLTAITNTQLLLNFTNGSIVDATGKNDLETVGNAQISTSVKKFGTGSMAFDGTGDYLLWNGGNLFAFGTGDFTIEFWLQINNTTGTQAIYDGRPQATNGAQPIVFLSSGSIRYQTSGVLRITGSTLSTGQWYHIAVCRSGTSTKLFVDGTQSGSTFTDTTNYVNGANRPAIGADAGTSFTNGLNGYLDDFRVTKFARYPSDFTPPYRQLPTR